MVKNNPPIGKASLRSILPKPPYDIKAHESLIWLEESRTLHMYIAYTEGKTQEEMAIYMAILNLRMAEYGPWANNIQLLFHPRVIRLYENPSIYAQHVSEMKALVNRINQSFKVVTHINIRIKVDYANFQQMKLAASFLALEKNWNLFYYFDGILRLIEIDEQSILMRRLRGVYDRDFKVQMKYCGWLCYI
ncbi:hypothetical protein SBOR_9821 [Sclerotinia borealis F-4128]|uniref:Uncharacterized protein n=1 Tax=Sclerotinia borealis (strain F-4128) TaxID=1432307 RepID=W9BZ13_SCLBF|nr:hypothetical protein SBOR_9821 [Sclerotinia borealis F-4128]